MRFTRKNQSAIIGVFILFMGMALSLSSCTRQDRKEKHLEQTAREAFLYGYPLVLMDKNAKFAAAITQTQTKQKKVSMYEFVHVHNPRQSRLREVLAFDNEMLYSMAWVHVAQDPVILSVPASDIPYYVGGLIGAWADIFGVIGTRVTGSKAQKFFISGPQWQGKTPEGMTALQSRTNFVWLPIRIYARTEKERAEALAFQKNLKIEPLSSTAKNQPAPSVTTADLNIDTKLSPRDAIFNMSAEEYYRTLCALMVENPPAPIDEPLVARLRNLGIVPTKTFKFGDLPAETQNALNASLKNSKSYLLSQRNAFSPTGRLINGWTVPVDDVNAGIDYHRRAYEAYMHLGNLPPQDAVFAVAFEDNMGQQLMGENSYKITFPKNQLPPTNAFWTLTMYHLPEIAFSGRRYERDSVSSATKLKPNPDGSITIYLQPKSPGKNRDSNWLASRPGNYQLSLHLYWPKVEVLDGRWNPPVVERVDQERMAKF